MPDSAAGFHGPSKSRRLLDASLSRELFGGPSLLDPADQAPGARISWSVVQELVEVVGDVFVVEGDGV